MGVLNPGLHRVTRSQMRLFSGAGATTQNPDFTLLAISLTLTLFGLVMVASSSAPAAYATYQHPEQLFVKQLIAAIVGLILLFLFSRLDYRKLFAYDGILMIVAIAVTFLTLIPSLAPGGLWLRLGGFSFQPTEFAKFALLIFLAASLVRKSESGEIRDFMHGVVPFFVLFGVLAVLAMAQPDFAMVIEYGALLAFMLIIGGARLIHLTAPALPAVPVFFALIMTSEYRRDRLLTFLNPFADPDGRGYHLIQSLTALGSGGLLGRGLGASREKWLYLPSAYNDFILSVVGEELGLIGLLLILSLFIIFAWRGLQIALHAPDRFGFFLAAGITFSITFQAAINFGVTTGVLPVTGLTLPLVSYGGTSLIISLAMIGILLNISRSVQPARTEAAGLL